MRLPHSKKVRAVGSGSKRKTWVAVLDVFAFKSSTSQMAQIIGMLCAALVLHSVPPWVC